MSAPRITALHHVALPVSDLARSTEFYRDVLGLQQIERPAAFDFPGAWFALGEGQLHLIERRDGTLRAGKPLDSRDTHFAIRVDDFDAMLAHLRSLGYRDDAAAGDIMRLKANRTPNAGFPQIFVMDPDRHVIDQCARITRLGSRRRLSNHREVPFASATHHNLQPSLETRPAWRASVTSVLSVVNDDNCENLENVGT